MLSIIEQVMRRFGAEDREHYRVVQYCDAEGLDCWHVPNETYTENRFAKVKNKLLGVRPGVPDLFIIVNSQLIVIEMKSLTGSATKEQKRWVALFNSIGIPAFIAKGADVAIGIIKDFQDGNGKVPEPAAPASKSKPAAKIPLKPGFTDDLPF